MNLLRLRRTEADDATLLRRAHRGDRRAHRLYARRHAGRALYLVGLLVESAAQAPALAATALADAVDTGVAGDDALVRAAVNVASQRVGEPRLDRLVLALTDLEGRSEQATADLVGLAADEVATLRAEARAALGSPAVVTRECRGWILATRRDRLTERERDAANGHLALCRPCRVRLDEQRRTRDKLGISGAAVSAVFIADVVSLSVPSGGTMATAALSSLAVGKTGAAVAGAAILAVGAASTGVALVRQPTATPPGVVRHVNNPGGSQHATHTQQSRTAAPTTVRPASKPAVAPAPSLVPTSLPSSLRRVNAPVPVPTPTAVVPLPVPTALPTGLPPLPSPSIVVSVPALPTPLGSSR